MAGVDTKEYWQLQYARQRARNSVFMQAMATLARKGMQDFAKQVIERADNPSMNVRLKDFVTARTNGPTDSNEKES